jgi:protein SCO1/2
MSSSEASDPRKEQPRDDARDWGFGRPLFKNPWFYFAISMMAMLTVTRPYLRRVAEPLPVIREIPEFVFADANGSAFGSAQLAGRPYVASFIFTRCKTACPLISARMADLQKQLRDGGLPVRLVSLTVDASFDRPQVLQQYAAQHGALEGVWSFLTAPDGVEADAYAQQVEDTFAVAAAVAGVGESMSVMDLAHSERLFLVDGSGRLRGVFAATPEGIGEIFHRAVTLMGEPKS